MSKVSIIIPVYNAEDYLKRCLDSIVNQTFKDIEIICVNDGSKDNSLKILKEYEDPRIVIIDKENAGVSEARNDGIKASNGEYITFVDADDWLEIDAIENMHNAIIEEYTDLIIAPYYINKNSEAFEKLETLNGFENRKFFGEYREIYEKMCSGKLTCSVWGVLFKSEMLKKAPKFKKDIRYGEDLIFMIEVLKIVKSIKFIETPVYHYFYNENSATNSTENLLKNIYSMSDAYEVLVDLLDTENTYIECLSNNFGKKIMSNLFQIYLLDEKTSEDWKIFFKKVLEKKSTKQILENATFISNSIHLKIPFELINKKQYKNLVSFYRVRKFARNLKEKMKKMILKLKIFIAQILFYIKYFFIKNNNYDILSDEETLKKITKENYSVARYGDGEFRLMLEKKGIGFQCIDEKLSEKLRKIIIASEIENKIIIGVPASLKGVKGYSKEAKRFWINYWVQNFNDLKPYLKQKEYCNTNLTRPYMDYKNKNEVIMQKKFNDIKKIWDKRDVVIIEGEKTMLGVGNDLFDNCNSIDRIICPAKNAFEKYDQILEEAQKVEKDKLFLISLGPTATVLAYDLAREGYQAIDTGHIDIEYMWFKMGATTKEAIKGKYVNEAKNNDYLTEIKDEKYESEIIARVI